MGFSQSLNLIVVQSRSAEAEARPTLADIAVGQKAFVTLFCQPVDPTDSINIL